MRREGGLRGWYSKGHSLSLSRAQQDARFNAIISVSIAKRYLSSASWYSFALSASTASFTSFSPRFMIALIVRTWGVAAPTL